MDNHIFPSMEDLMDAIKAWVKDNPDGVILSADREKYLGWLLMPSPLEGQSALDWHEDGCVHYNISFEDYSKWAKKHLIAGMDMNTSEARVKLAACFSGLAYQEKQKIASETQLAE